MPENEIKFIFNGKEKIVKVFANLKECKEAFQKEFSLTDEEMDYIRFYFKDEEDDETFMDSDEDYNIFLDSDCSKVIEGREHKYYKN